MNDLARSNVFSKVTQQIITAIRAGKGESDPSLNLMLSSALAQARQAQMPKINIEQAIKKGLGSGDSSGDEPTTIYYEGLGPSGVACIVEALTCNRNKTFNEVRHLFFEYGSLTPVAYLFRKSGFVLIESDQLDKVMDDAIQSGMVLDVQEMGNNKCELECEISHVLKLKREMASLGHQVLEGDVRFESQDRIKVNDQEIFYEFIDAMESLDNIVRVHHNAATGRDLTSRTSPILSKI